METKEFTAASFTEYLAGHKLMGTRCTDDGELFLPPRAYCPGCKDGTMEWVEFSGQGKLLTFTVVYIGPAAMIAAGFDRKNPYAVGIVELAEGPRISAMITGVDPLQPESIALGAPVTLDIQDLGPEGAKKPVLAFRMN
jgi:uncharacterized OB-fold protein